MDVQRIYDIVRKIPFLKPLRTYRQICKVKSYKLSKHEIIYAQKSTDNKKRVIEKHIRKHSKRAEALKGQIGHVINEAYHGADLAGSLALDMYFSYFAYGFTPNEYACYGFAGKPLKERLRFVSDRESVCYGFTMNDIDAVRLLNNKNKSYELLKKYYKRDAIRVSLGNDEQKFYDFIEKHKVFVKKQADESCGRSVERVDAANMGCPKEELFRRYISGGEKIIEEVIRQSEVMAGFNPSSVNTVRCFTIRTNGGVIAPFCFLKAGRAGSFVDNGGAGGILAGIDEKTGILNTDGVDELNRRYPAHPDSGVRFRGFQLPDWQQMLSICREMADLIPGARYIGWDMAYTDKGWAAVEGNGLSEAIGPQATSKKGIRCFLKQYTRRKGWEYR